MASKRSTDKPTISQHWRKILQRIPSYDPIKTAGNCLFKPELAQRVIDFFHECLHFIEDSTGHTAGEPFTLELWQQAILANLFGWVRPDGTRRYREAFILVPKKNGKTPLAAGIALYLLFAEEEQGSQIYSAAADRDQASLIYRHATAMLHAEPELDSRGEVYVTSRTIVKKGTLCKYQALSADVPTKHGLNISGLLIDELHAQPNRHLVDTLLTGTASRRQPLVISITTADFERPSICNEKYAYAKKVREGMSEDMAFLPVIYEAPTDADWKDPKVWADCNPNLGVSVSLEYLQRECQRAIETPSFQNAYKRLHLNMATAQDIRWLMGEDWQACYDPTLQLEELAGQPCFAGVDLGQVSDLSSLILYFPEQHAFLAWYWLPEETIYHRQETARVPYPEWVGTGEMQATEGNVTDYDVIREDIIELAESYAIQEIAIDPSNSTQLQTQLTGEGFRVVRFNQSFRALSPPSKELERLLVSRQLRHMNDPVTRWCAGNVTLETNAAGEIRPSKARSSEKIDGIVALVMALGRALVMPAPQESVYNTRGILVI